MIVCKNCGHQNEDNDTFCGSCGKFLEWSGERVAVAEPEPEPEAPPEPAPAEPTRVGLLDRVKHAVGIDETAPAAAPPQQPAAPVSPVPSAATAAAPTTAAPPARPYEPPPSAPLRPVPMTSASPSATATPPTAAPSRYAQAPESAPERQPVLAGVGAPAAASPVAEPLSQEPVSQKPVFAAQPKPTRRAPAITAPTRKAGPDDVYCGQCGEVNDKTRHFCRRCGNSLDEAIAVRLPWYRRAWNRIIRGRTYTAGERRRRVGPPNVLGPVFRVLRLAIAAILVLAVLAFALNIQGFRTYVTNRVTTAVNTIRLACCPRYTAIYATGADASTSIAGHPQTLAIDHFVNTYWAAAPNDPKPLLTIHFADKVDIAEIGFDSGPSGSGPMDAFPKQPRPHSVHIVCSDGTTKDLTLKDEDPAVAKNAQFYALDAKQVTYVEIFINTTYAAPGAPSSVAISEVEFKTKD